MKSAITIVPETERISPMFDAAEHVLLLDCRCRIGRPEPVVAAMPSDIPGKIEFLRNNGVDLVITGAISNEDVQRLHELGIRVCPFVSGRWEDVWMEWKTVRKLSACHVMPGCCGHHRKCCRRNQSK